MHCSMSYGVVVLCFVKLFCVIFFCAMLCWIALSYCVVVWCYIVSLCCIILCCCMVSPYCVIILCCCMVSPYCVIILCCCMVSPYCVIILCCWMVEGMFENTTKIFVKLSRYPLLLYFLPTKIGRYIDICYNILFFFRYFRRPEYDRIM